MEIVWLWTQAEAEEEEVEVKEPDELEELLADAKRWGSSSEVEMTTYWSIQKLCLSSKLFKMYIMNPNNLRNVKQIKNPIPILWKRRGAFGVLLIRVLAAHNLINADWFSLSDPYAKAECLGKRERIVVWVETFPIKCSGAQSNLQFIGIPTPTNCLPKVTVDKVSKSTAVVDDCCLTIYIYIVWGSLHNIPVTCCLFVASRNVV